MRPKSLRISNTRSTSIRSFIAVPIPESTRERVAAVQARLRGPAGVKWVEPDLFHFTLRFLGSISAATVADMETALFAALADQQAFPITLAGVGAFPQIRRPQTIWVGVTEGAYELEALATGVETAVEQLGFPPEARPFRAHLTLGRVKAPRPPQELVAALQAETPGALIDRMLVDRVLLMRSDLGRTGPRYTPLAEFPLRQ
ncbi:MAG TPA: RNA 2',3'-cyclic phosphodiesterase [Armatimonadota bacterium]|nr:RNA 2',3'-cyclic phosphodiesterase [Armatimonadota bacterium]